MTIPKAATVLVIRENPTLEVFMVRRTSKSSFMPDAFVYPGGRLDPDDDHEYFGNSDTEDALQIAAVRETFEEAGFLLADPAGTPRQREDWRTELDQTELSFSELCSREKLEVFRESMHFIAHWITPIAESKRFDTYFFLVDAPMDQAPSHDEKETTASLWVTPADALTQHRKGEFILFPPTYRTLEILADFGSCEEALAWAEAEQPTPILPYFHPDADNPTVVMAGDPDYPDDDVHSGFEPQPKGATRIVLREGAWVTE